MGRYFYLQRICDWCVYSSRNFDFNFSLGRFPFYTILFHQFYWLLLNRTSSYVNSHWRPTTRLILLEIAFSAVQYLLANIKFDCYLPKGWCFWFHSHRTPFHFEDCFCDLLIILQFCLSDDPWSDAEHSSVSAESLVWECGTWSEPAVGRSTERVSIFCSHSYCSLFTIWT